MASVGVQGLTSVIGRSYNIGGSLLTRRIVPVVKQWKCSRYSWSDKEPRKRLTMAEKLELRVPCFRAVRRTEFRCDPNAVFAPDSDNQYLIDVMRCMPDCYLRVPVLDDEHYRPSDKNREYQQTWCDCVPIDYERVRCKEPKPRNIPRRDLSRPPPPPPKTACPQDLDRMDFVCKIPTARKDASYSGPPTGKEGCLKITMPRCQAVRKSLHCLKMRSSANCTKRCTQYPSYSECDSRKRKSSRAVECGCNNTLPMCVVWREFRKRNHNVEGDITTRICENW